MPYTHLDPAIVVIWERDGAPTVRTIVRGNGWKTLTAAINVLLTAKEGLRPGDRLSIEPYVELAANHLEAAEDAEAPTGRQARQPPFVKEPTFTSRTGATAGRLRSLQRRPADRAAVRR